MPEPINDLPENLPGSIKILPRKKVRRIKTAKKNKLVDRTKGKNDSRIDDDDLASIYRLLQLLSKKPAGKSLLVSLLSEEEPLQKSEETKPVSTHKPALDTYEHGNDEKLRHEEQEFLTLLNRPAAETESAPQNTQTIGPESDQKEPTAPAAREPVSPVPKIDEALGVALQEAYREQLAEEEFQNPAEEAALGEADQDSPLGDAKGNVPSIQRQGERITRGRSSRTKRSQPYWRAAGFPILKMALFVVLVAGFYLSSLVIAFNIGLRENRRAAALRLLVAETDSLSSGKDSKLESAISAIREGDPDSASEALNDLTKRQPPIRSLNYLRALAALQSGNLSAAKKFFEESIALGERVSDSYALLAQISPEEASHKLEHAIVADPLNPAPFIELASLMRKDGHIEDTVRLLRAAQNRQLPVNTHISTEALEHLIQLENTPDAELPKEPPGRTRVVKLWSEAYLALREKNFQRAEETLSSLQQEIDIDTFRYIVNDPAFRLYLSEPSIERFFRL